MYKKRSNNKKPKEEAKYKIKINTKTEIFCRTEEQLEIWKAKYPGAVVTEMR